MAKNFSFYLSLVTFFFSFTLWGVTSGIQYGIPAVIQLNAEGKGTCTGTIVGDKPLRVLTAEHCLVNSVDGGIEIQDPSAVLDPTLSSSKVKRIRSTKVFLSKESEYQKLISERNALRLEAQERVLVIEMAQKKLGLMEQGTKGGTSFFLFVPNKSLSQEEHQAIERVLVDAKKEKAEIEIKLSDLEEKLFMFFTDYDMAVLVFPTALPGDLSVEQRVKSRHIVPISRNTEILNEVPVVIGGFGLTGASTQLQTSSAFVMRGSYSHFTTNVIAPNPENSNFYMLHGIFQEDLDKEKVALGTKGSPLKGDSGSAVLSERGIIAVTAAIHTHNSHLPPTKDWRNDYEGKSNYLKNYRYITSYFPSTSSAIARDIFAQVEAEVGPLVYSDQISNYEKVFQSEKQSLLETARIQDLHRNLILQPK